ncbi:MAG: peptidylprolyl isomerase [Proteobacteria bacterium]|nr:peptidylprolyl isomerase [Pseudomonadota bacterium]HQR04289.1 peptidylprolyl isomerase [Rhodocyclaceae bacterium]
MNAISKILFAWLAIFLCVPMPAQARGPEEVDRIVAVVNNEAITLSEFRAKLASVERQLQSRNIPLPARDVLEHQLLERMIVDRIQIQMAKDAGAIPNDSELDAALRRIAEGNHMALPDFKAALEKDGVQWSRFREEVRDEITLNRVRQNEVDSRITVSDTEVNNYLAAVASAGDAAVSVSLAHILVRAPEQASPEQLTRLKAKAEQALAQIRRGDDFAKVAASFSDAPDALTGGVISARTLDRLPTLYAEAAKKLQPGEVSDVLQSSAGFHIVKLIERKGGVSDLPAIRQTHARHILIRVDDKVSEAEGRRKIDAIKERLDHGASFAEMARLYSNDPSGAKGGDLGWLGQGDTVPEFEQAMDALPVGKVSAPVLSPFGWHLIEVLERRTDEGSEDRKRLAARIAVRDRKADEAYQDWLRQIRDKAYVEYRLEDQ